MSVWFANDIRDADDQKSADGLFIHYNDGFCNLQLAFCIQP